MSEKLKDLKKQQKMLRLKLVASEIDLVCKSLSIYVFQIQFMVSPRHDLMTAMITIYEHQMVVFL